jgi:hypothetical protein
VGDRPSAARILDLPPRLRADISVEAGKPPRKRRQCIFVALPERDAEHELVECHRTLALERPGVGLIALAHSDRIDDHEMVL